MRYPRGNERQPDRQRYELRNAAGGVLQGNSELEPLLKYLDQKAGCVVVRTKDEEVLARSPAEKLRGGLERSESEAT